MVYWNIAPPFFEDNRQFFERLVKDYKHGDWIEQQLYDTFICLLSARPAPAFYEQGELSVYGEISERQDWSLWSVCRQLEPGVSIIDNDADIEIFAYLDSFGTWQFYGQVRMDFLIKEAGTELEMHLLDAASKFSNPEYWVGKA